MEKVKWSREVEWTASRAAIPPRLEMRIIFVRTAQWGFTTRASREPRLTFWRCDRESRSPRTKTDAACLFTWTCELLRRGFGVVSKRLRRLINAHREFQPSIIHETGGGCAIVDSNCGARRVRASGHSSRQGSAPKYIQPSGSEDGHQLPRYVDVFERISRIPGSASGADGSVELFREHV